MTYNDDLECPHGDYFSSCKKCRSSRLSFAEIAEGFIDEINAAFPEDDGSIRHDEALQSFIAYCEAHPKERFWQALRNWSTFSYILGFDGDLFKLTGKLGAEFQHELTDTFYYEGLSGTDEAYR